MTYTHYLKALKKKSASMMLLMKIDPWYYNMDDGSTSEINDHSYNYDGVDEEKESELKASTSLNVFKGSKNVELAFKCLNMHGHFFSSLFNVGLHSHMYTQQSPPHL